MMQSYRRKEIFPTYDEAAFLDTLAMQMNTSVEQLRATYIGLDSSDYIDTARALIRALAVTTDPEASDDPIDCVEEKAETSGFFL